MQAHRAFFALSLIAAAPLAQGNYTAEIVGQGVVINDMNELGEVVGWTSSGGVQAYVCGPDHPLELLPLPTGYASAWAQGINDAGSIVGSVATGSFPEFGEAAAWHPDGTGGWNIELLGQLPGHTMSVAHDINNRGDIVGFSLFPGFGGGPTVWFNSPSGVLELGSLGAPSSPKQINDEGVIVGISGGLFDIDTLSPLPLPPFPGGTNGFQGWAVNDHGELAGKAFHGSQISASVWTAAGGWQSISSQFGQSASVQAFDINDSGLTYAEVPAPAAFVPGVGTVLLSAMLIPEQQGKWSFVTSLGGAVNDAGQIAAIGLNDQGQSGIVVLTPENFADLGAGLAGIDGVPQLEGQGSLAPGSPTTLTLSHARPGAPALLIAGLDDINAPLVGGTLVPAPDVLVALSVDSGGGNSLTAPWPAGLTSGAQLYLQAWIVDPAGPAGFSASNALVATVP